MKTEYPQQFSTIEERIEYHIKAAVTLLGVIEGLATTDGDLVYRYSSSANIHATIAQTLTSARVQNLAHAAIASMAPEGPTAPIEATS